MYVPSLPDDYAELITVTKQLTKKHLASYIVNKHYNDFLDEMSDFGKDEKPVTPSDTKQAGYYGLMGIFGASSGKRIPYQGWYWRAVDFYDKNVPIGDNGEFVGFMESNKWGYPGRYLTIQEFTKLMAVIDAAMEESNRDKKLILVESIWPLMQTFTIPTYNNQIIELGGYVL